MDQGVGNLLLIALMGVVFYFVIIRPQRARQAAQQRLISSLGPGDRIVTIGGFHATVVELDDDTLRVELAPGTVTTIARAAVGRRLVDADDGVAGPTDGVDGPTDAGGATAADG